MKMKYFVVWLLGLVGATQLFAAESDLTQTVKISYTSIKIGEVELRSGAPQGKYHYISRAAAEKALGPIADTYSPGRVIVYAWPNVGIQIQEGLRGTEEGKIFKLLVFFEDDYDARSEKNSGKFNGQVQVDGMEIGPATAFETIRDELKKKGYKVTDGPQLSYARKTGPWGHIEMYRSEASGKIKWIEVWCL
jgi:hypothetical protein